MKEKQTCTTAFDETIEGIEQILTARLQLTLVQHKLHQTKRQQTSHGIRNSN
jgi:hypothetical protein